MKLRNIRKTARTAIMLVLVLTMLLSMTACGGGGGETDPNAGVYNGVSAEVMGFSLPMSDVYEGATWIELNSGGKGTIALDGEEFKIKWALNGEELTITVSGEDSIGTLIDNVIAIDFMNMGCLMTFEREAAVALEGTASEDTAATDTAAASPAADDVQITTKSGLGQMLCSHDWLSATCLRPKTCVKCGKTEGVASGHSFGEATHQYPSTCALCGETTGEKLPAGFEEHDLCYFMEMGETYDYTTQCAKYKKAETVGKLQVVSYEIVRSTKDFMPEEGYEWRIVTMETVYSDWNARKYGIQPYSCYEDYYNIELLDDNNYYNEETGYNHYPILYNGEEYEVQLSIKNSWSKWKSNKITETTVYAARVPIGYDGVVVGKIDFRVDYDGKHIYNIYNDEQFLLFRMY